MKERKVGEYMRRKGRKMGVHLQEATGERGCAYEVFICSRRRESKQTITTADPASQPMLAYSCVRRHYTRAFYVKLPCIVYESLWSLSSVVDPRDMRPRLRTAK